MFDILMEIMEPQIEAMLKEEREKAIMIGEQRGIHIGEQNGIQIGEQMGIHIGEQAGEQRGIRIGEQLGIQTGKIQGAIDMLREFGHPEPDIKAKIIKKYNLSPSEADDYLSEVIPSELPFQ